jgi:DNA-binding transcriptional LysR family regulator
MKFDRWQDIEFRHLGYAIAVKKHQGFIQAAIALDLDQGFLSRQIQRLEADLEFKLFDRSSRPLGLTESGRDFLIKAEQILAQMQRAVALGQETQAGQWGSLTVGINTSIANSELPAIVQAFCHRFPHVKLTLHELASYDQIKQLNSNQIDVGFFHRHNLNDLPEEDRNRFVVTPILSEPLVLVLPEHHPAAKRSPVSLSSLSGAPFVLPPRTLLYGLRGQIDELFRHANCIPTIVQEAAWITTVLSLVAGDIGVSLLPANVTQLQRKGVVYRPIEETSPVLDIVAIWQSNNPSATLKNFLDVIELMPHAKGG